MKLSLKSQGHDDKPQHQHTTQLMTAKVPVTIFKHPFISSISASSTSNNSTNSDFSFSLSTNFQSGPSLKLSYFPTTTAAASTSSSSSSIPFSLSLKSGLGLLGSPRNSPLVFSANFTLSPSLIPTASFLLHLKPQFGHFSLNKTVSSETNTKPYSLHSSLHNNNNNNNNNNGAFWKGFASSGSSSGWQELKLEPFGGRENTHMNNNIGFVPERSLVGKNNEKRVFLPGVAVMARTVLPVTKGLLLNLRWGVNLPWYSGVKMPFLTVNKIGLERVVDDVKQNKDQGNETFENDLQLLKGIYFCMKRDLEVVEKENMAMKRLLDEMRMGVTTNRNFRDGSNGGGGGGRKLSPQQHSVEGSSEFERWRNKKCVREENEKKEQPKKQQQQQQGVVSDVESELQKAIKAAASASS